MSEFIYVLRPSRIAMVMEGPTERERALVGAHFEYLRSLHAHGTVVLAGRTGVADERVFGVVIFRAATPIDAERVMRDDPAVQEGVMTAELHPFRVALPEAPG